MFLFGIKYYPIFLTLVFCTNVLLAQDIQNDSANTLKEVKVVAPSKSENDLGATLDFKSVKGDQLILKQGNTLTNTLERIPGVSSINVGVGISKPVIRGLSLNRVIVNEYGIKQEGQQWGVDHGLELDQFNVERLEIVKGPVSVLYGSDGIGGVINIYPSFLPKTNSFNGDVLINGKSNNDLIGTSIKLQGNKNDVFLITRVTCQDYGSYRVPANEFTYNGYVLPIYNNRLKNTAGREVNFSFLAGVKRKWGYTRIYLSNFSHKAGFFVGAFGVPRAYQLFDDGLPRKIGIPNQNLNHFKLVSNTYLAFGENYLELDGGYQQNIRNEFSLPHAHGTGDNSSGNLSLALNLETFTLNIKFTHIINQKIRNIYGVNGQYQSNKMAGHEFLIPAFKAANVGLFVFSEYKLNGRFLVSGGLRLDAARQNSQRHVRPLYDSQLNYIMDIQMAPDFKKKYFSLSGSVGASNKLSESLKLKANIGSAFRVPVIAELSANGLHHGTFRHEQGDSSISPERGYMLDLGLYFNKAKKEFSVTPFLNYFTNYIYLSPSAKFSLLPDAGQIYKYQETNALFWGIESSVFNRFNSFFTNEVGVEYVWNINVRNNLPLPFTPPFSILEEVTITPFKRNQIKEIAFNVSSQYYASQNRVDRNEPATLGYFLMHFSLSHDFYFYKTKLSFYGQIRNLTNTRYLNNMSRYRILNLPEQGRNFQLIVKYSF